MSLYTDKNTNLLHEVKLFETFAIVRPVDPARAREMRKLDLLAFDKEFYEYSGNHEDIYRYFANNLELGVTIQ